jgi:hypothetical protein
MSAEEAKKTMKYNKIIACPPMSHNQTISISSASSRNTGTSPAGFSNTSLIYKNAVKTTQEMLNDEWEFLIAKHKNKRGRLYRQYIIQGSFISKTAVNIKTAPCTCPICK